MQKYNTIHIALPLMGERDYISGLIKSLNEQTFTNFQLHVIINQPDHYWQNEIKKWICLNNQDTIRFLKDLNAGFNMDILDYSSKGKGWDRKNLGVGWARKTVMDHINMQADENDLVVSIDGDTVFNPEYLKSIIDNFNKNQHATVLSVPYYHPLLTDERANRAILHYEIYMRNYAINLWRVSSPYAFTALGSAIVFPIWSYRKIGGMTPKKSGEDFYFLQKMRKSGDMMIWNKEKVYPGTRFSDRVFFGTGPAMIKGDAGDWNSYPIYHYSLFDEIRRLYDSFAMIYNGEADKESNSMTEMIFGSIDVWDPLIKNSKNVDQFIKAAHLKFDGLRVLQFLKSRQQAFGISDEECLKENLKIYYPDYINDEVNSILVDLSFNRNSTEELDLIRNLLVRIEEDFQRENKYASSFINQ